MARISIILLITTAILSSCSIDSIVISEEDLTEDIFYMEDNITPYSGKCIIKYHRTNHIKEEITFKKGILNGEAISYYENGEVKRRGYYKDGYLSGKWEFFDNSGVKDFEITYLNDTLNGKYISYHNNGSIKEEGCYQLNKKTGEWKFFNISGNLVEKVSYN